MGFDLGPDPHRLERDHVVNVRLDRSGKFFVVISNGEECTWDQWCDWDCVDLRRTALAAADARTGETDGEARGAVGRDGSGGGNRNDADA